MLRLLISLFFFCRFLGPSRLTNGHAKRSNPGSSRPTLKMRICRTNVSKKIKYNESDISESDLSANTDSSDSPALLSIPRTRARTAAPSVSVDSDSGDDYVPGGRSKPIRKNRGKNNKNGKQTKSKPKSNVIVDDDDDEEVEANEDNEEEEDERFVAQESTEEEEEEDESEDEKFIKRDTRSRKLTTDNEKNQKYNANNDKNSDSESEENDEEEEEERLRENFNEDSDSDVSYKVFKPSLRGSRRQQRNSANTKRPQNTRRQCRKRPHYEESDDSITPVRNRRKIKRRFYAEDSDESMPEAEPEPQPGISISSRGRVRKLTPRARAYVLGTP